MKIIFQIDGGIGKSIAATAVCKAIKAQYPNDELIVITGYPDVFLCNPGMKVYGFHELRYFYEQYIFGNDYRILAHNPYLETAFIKGDMHLLKVWCEMFGIKYNGEIPELFINNREQTFHTNHFAGQNLFASQKPLLLIQTNGGGADQPNKYSWARDMPLSTAQQVVDAFANEYNIIHIRRDDQLPLRNVTQATADFRALAVLIQLSEKRLFIDSFAQHAAAALGKPSVVCMIDDLTATHFGYDMHTTIIAHPPTIKPELRHAVYNKYNISGIPTEFPYNNESEIYDVNKIIEAIRNTPASITTEPIPEPEKAKQNGSAKNHKKEEPVEVS
jgi:hypothetical protein